MNHNDCKLQLLCIPHYMPQTAVLWPELLTEQEAIYISELDSEENSKRTLKYYVIKGQLRGLKIGLISCTPNRTP